MLCLVQGQSYSAEDLKLEALSILLPNTAKLTALTYFTNDSFQVVRSHQSTLRTPVITLYQSPGTWSIKHGKPYLWNLNREQKLLRPNSKVPQWKQPLSLQTWTRERMPQKIPRPALRDGTLIHTNAHLRWTAQASQSDWYTHPSKSHLGIQRGSMRWTARCQKHSIGSKSCKKDRMGLHTKNK